jgi:hypothetical protein
LNALPGLLKNPIVVPAMPIIQCLFFLCAGKFLSVCIATFGGNTETKKKLNPNKNITFLWLLVLFYFSVFFLCAGKFFFLHLPRGFALCVTREEFPDLLPQQE